MEPMLDIINFKEVSEQKTIIKMINKGSFRFKMTK
jgi:hypothetical protein